MSGNAVLLWHTQSWWTLNPFLDSWPPTCNRDARPAGQESLKRKQSKGTLRFVIGLNRRVGCMKCGATGTTSYSLLIIIYFIFYILYYICIFFHVIYVRKVITYNGNISTINKTFMIEKLISNIWCGWCTVARPSLLHFHILLLFFFFNNWVLGVREYALIWVDIDLEALQKI